MMFFIGAKTKILCHENGATVRVLDLFDGE
jgi:hypothetical protein